jgi:hypothetical protein
VRELADRTPRRDGHTLSYQPGTPETTPRIDSSARCDRCQGWIVWDEVHGWVHAVGTHALEERSLRMTKQEAGRTDTRLLT